MRFVNQSLIAAVIGCGFLFGAGPVWAGDSAKGRAADEMKWGYKAAKRGYWLEALDRFEKADRLTPNQARILNNIAVALEASGQFEEAMVAYKSALDVAPNDKVLRNNFSRFNEFYDTQFRPDEKTAEDAGDVDDVKVVPLDEAEEDDDA